MSEPNWELKDRRMAWMNMNSACSNILAARIEAGLFKPKDNKEAIKELLDAIGIEFSVYLTLGIGEGSPKGGEEKPLPQKPKGKTDYSFFCSECNVGISEKVKDYSESNFGLALCFDCQKKAREQVDTAVGPKDVQK